MDYILSKQIPALMPQEKLVAYFTGDRCYALACCRDRNQNFVTMGLGGDGKQHYYERFPNQLPILYGGRPGYIYAAETAGGLRHTKGHTWESETDVPVRRYEAVEDVYSEILDEKKFYLTYFSPLWT